MTTPDPTITIAGLRAQIDSLYEMLKTANNGRAEKSSAAAWDYAKRMRVEAERDALAAQLAEVHAELADTARDLEQFTAESEAIVQIVGTGPDDSLPVAVRSIVAHLAACQTRIAGLEQAANERSKEVARLTEEIGKARNVAFRVAYDAKPYESLGHAIQRVVAERDRLTARVAELEARPALTVEQLAAALDLSGPLTADGESRGQACRRIAERVMTWIGAPPTSPTVAVEMRLCEATRVVLRPGTLYRFTVDDGCEACRDAATMSPPAARPVFAGVSVDELARVSADAYDGSADQIGDADRAATRAVLARLEVSLVTPVDPREFALVMIMRDLTDDNGDVSTTAVEAAARYALTARGIPVTPEVDK